MKHGVAIVTGAGSGIGRAAAKTLAEAGWSVALAGRRVEALELVAQAMNDRDAAYVVPTDVTNEAQVVRLFDSVMKRWGRVDFVFNNAGAGAPMVPLDQLALSQWQSVVDVNLTGMFLCIREAFRVMKAQDPRGGRIVNNGSLAAHVPRPNSVAYSATKHAVTGLTRSAALDGREFNIAVGQIDIGNAATELAMRGTQGVVQANGELASEPMMDVAIAAQAVLAMAALPLEANVLFQTVMATRMPFLGRG